MLLADLIPWLLYKMNVNWEVAPLLVGFIFSYIIYTYKKFRLGGVISIPLLAIYTIKFPLIALVIILSSIIIFIFLEILMERFVLYGRRLLYISMILSVLFMVLIELSISKNPEWYAMLLSGLMAYNYHREAHSGVDITKSIAVYFLLYFVCLVSSAVAFFIIK